MGVVARAPFRIPGSGLGSSLVWMLLHVLVPVIRVKGVLLPVPLSRFQVQHGVGFQRPFQGSRYKIGVQHGSVLVQLGVGVTTWSGC